jgi:ABC-type sugar transport system, periplasmic component
MKTPTNGFQVQGKLTKLNNILFRILIFLAMLCTLTYIFQQFPSSMHVTNPTVSIAPSVQSQPPSPVQSKGKIYVIGWSVYNASYEYFETMQQGVLAKAKELGIQVISNDQKSSTEEMVRGALNLIDQGIDALVISPFDPRAMAPIVTKAKEKGIPVVVVDVGTGNTDVDAFILSDNFGGGIYAGEYALQLIKEHNITSKNVAILKVEETSTYARRRGDGFKRVMEDAGYNIVAEVTANSETDQAYEAMKKILEEHGDDLAVVFCENDRMALGAAQAIDEAGKKGQIMVIGFDGIPSAVDAIKKGLMQGTIAQQPYEMGELGTDIAQALLTGGSVLYDDPAKKELYMPVYLIDETGTARK